MTSDQQIKKKSGHMKEIIKISGSQQKKADPTQEPEVQETGLMSTGPSVLQNEVKRENGQGACYSQEAV